MVQVSVANYFPQSFLNENSLHVSLGEEFSLGENGVMVFHWSDFFETCDSVKFALENDPELLADFKRRELGIEQHSKIPVWIRTRNKVHQSNMFDPNPWWVGSFWTS